MIIALQRGEHITPTRQLSQAQVSNWKYSAECASVLGGLLPGALLKIVDISTAPGAMWVQAELPGRFPSASLKISGEEFAWNFERAR